MQAIGRQPQRAPDGATVYHKPHRPEQTTLYQLVRQHAASFIAHTEASTGAELPRLIKDEFDAFLECGILAQGFLRLRCGECGYDKLLAFSGKRRGFCPSCGARRMSQTAAHLVDHVIPHVLLPRLRSAVPTSSRSRGPPPGCTAMRWAPARPSRSATVKATLSQWARSPAALKAVPPTAGFSLAPRSTNGTKALPRCCLASA